MTGIKSLPREIRNMIYEYCLVKNYTLVPYKEYYPVYNPNLEAERNDLPTVALLRVDKTIGAEAAEVFYRKNVWRVTAHVSYIRNPLRDRYNEASVRTLWHRRATLFKHIVLVLDQRDMCMDAYHDATFIHDYRKTSYTVEQHREHLHAEAEQIMKESWRDKFGYICYMENLASMTLDVNRLFCHMGCCRKQILECFLAEFSTVHYVSED